MIQVDHRTAALLFYALQTASSNLSRTTFEPRPQQVVIDPSSIPDTSLGDDAWYKEEFQSEEAETDRDDETSDTIHATVDIQAMADCVGESVGTGLRPVLTGQRPVTTQTDSLDALDLTRKASARVPHPSPPYNVRFLIPAEGPGFCDSGPTHGSHHVHSYQTGPPVRRPLPN